MAGTRKSNKKKEKRNGFSFFSDMDPDKKSLIFKGLGLLVCVFTVFTLVASVSYLMTWREDQSLMSDPAMMDKGMLPARSVSVGDTSSYAVSWDWEVLHSYF